MPQQIKNVLLVLTSIALSVLVAEAVVRYVDGYAMFAMPLSAPSGSATVGQDALDQVPSAAGVERDWFFTDPPPLPNRRKVPDEWNRLYRLVQDNPAGGMDFRPSDVFKAWN